MKKICIFALLLSLLACSKDFRQIESCESNLSYNTDSIVNYNLVVPEDAIKYANEFVGNNSISRTSSRTIESCEKYIAKTTRSTEGPEVSFYLINYKNNNGFALVSTDNRTTPVYLYAEEGNLAISELENNKGLAFFMQSAIPNYLAEIEHSNDNVVYNTLPNTDLIPPELLDLPTVYKDGRYYFCKTITENIDTKPMVYAYWHQAYPYNIYAGPFTGCGINSVGQIMSYHKHPTSYKNSIYDWEVINQHNLYTTECPASNMIAQLMYDMGQYLGVTYTSTGTSTTNEESRSLFIRFGYTCSQVTDYSSYTSHWITDEIDARRPVWIRGEDENFGHAWVIDAYRHTNITREYYQKVSPYALYCTQEGHTQTYYRCIVGYTNQYTPVYLLKTEFSTPNNVKFIYNIKPI